MSIKEYFKFAETVGENYDPWKVEPLPPEERRDFRKLSENLIGHAILAPSTHNTQPWQWRLNESSKTVDLLVNTERILPESDKNKRQSYISLGCALTNYRTASACYGFNSTIDYFPENDNTSVARITLTNFDDPNEENLKLLEVIKERRMNRSKYNPDNKIPDQILERMKVLTDKRNGIKLFTVQDAATKNAIAVIQEQADGIVFKTDKFRQELADWLIPNKTRSYLAMPGETFGLKDKMASKIHSALHAEGRFDPDLAGMIAIGDREGIRSSPVLGIICVDNDLKQSWVEAGEVFEEFALVSQHNKIDVAVNAALVEVGMLNSILKARLGTKMRPTVIFRMGYATEDRPHAPRLPVSEIVDIN